MSLEYRNLHQRRVDYYLAICRGISQEMSSEKWHIASDIIISTFVVFLTLQGNADSTISVIILGLINTISIAEIYRAFKVVKESERENYQDS